MRHWSNHSCVADLQHLAVAEVVGEVALHQAEEEPLLGPRLVVVRLHAVADAGEDVEHLAVVRALDDGRGGHAGGFRHAVGREQMAGEPGDLGRLQHGP